MTWPNNLQGDKLWPRHVVAPQGGGGIVRPLLKAYKIYRILKLSLPLDTPSLGSTMKEWFGTFGPGGGGRNEDGIVRCGRVLVRERHQPRLHRLHGPVLRG